MSDHWVPSLGKSSPVFDHPSPSPSGHPVLSCVDVPGVFTQSSSVSINPSPSASADMLIIVYGESITIANFCGPVGMLVPLTCISHCPDMGEDIVVPIRLSRLFPYSTQLPFGSFTAKSMSLTKLVDAAGVLAGSVHEIIIFRSGAPEGTVNFQERESPVETDSSSTQLVLSALSKSNNPHPSWLFGAVSPAPFVDDPY